MGKSKVGYFLSPLQKDAVPGLRLVPATFRVAVKAEKIVLEEATFSKYRESGTNLNGICTIVECFSENFDIVIRFARLGISM